MLTVVESATRKLRTSLDQKHRRGSCGVEELSEPAPAHPVVARRAIIAPAQTEAFTILTLLQRSASSTSRDLHWNVEAGTAALDLQIERRPDRRAADQVAEGGRSGRRLSRYGGDDVVLAQSAGLPGRVAAISAPCAGAPPPAGGMVSVIATPMLPRRATPFARI